jgi:hypothetical protein
MMKLIMAVSMVLSANAAFASAASSAEVVKSEVAHAEPCPFSKEAKARMWDKTNPTSAAQEKKPDAVASAQTKLGTK